MGTMASIKGLLGIEVFKCACYNRQMHRFGCGCMCGHIWGENEQDVQLLSNEGEHEIHAKIGERLCL